MNATSNSDIPLLGVENQGPLDGSIYRASLEGVNSCHTHRPQADSHKHLLHYVASSSSPLFWNSVKITSKYYGTFLRLVSTSFPIDTSCAGIPWFLELCADSWYGVEQLWCEAHNSASVLQVITKHSTCTSNPLAKEISKYFPVLNIVEENTTNYTASTLSRKNLVFEVLGHTYVLSRCN